MEASGSRLWNGRQVLSFGRLRERKNKGPEAKRARPGPQKKRTKAVSEAILSPTASVVYE
jgi:hypothetical protein